jgi:subtilisin family serine protease
MKTISKLLFLALAIFLLGLSNEPLATAYSHATLSPEINFLLSRHAQAPQTVFGPQGILSQTQTSIALQTVGVIIRTHSVDALRSRGIAINSVMGDVVTAKVSLSKLEQMAHWPEVIYVEGPGVLSPASEPVEVSMPQLVRSVPLTGALEWHEAGIDGTGVVIGVVDTGVDWTHMDFRTSRDFEFYEESTRLLGVWDQTHIGERPQGFSYGVEYTRTAIDMALGSEDYERIPLFDANPNAPSHGTQALGIVGSDGSSSELGIVGMAPGADLIAVKSPLTFDTVLDGVNYIFNKAGGRPAVASLSLGSHLGAHDGTSNFERALDKLANKPGHVVVVSAGNEGDEDIHIGGSLSSTESIMFTFDIPSNPDFSRYSFNFWYSHHPDAPLEVRVIGPGGQGVSSVTTGQLHDESTPVGGVFVDNASNGTNPNNGDNELLITVYGRLLGAKEELASGRWMIELRAPRLGLSFDGWALNTEFTSSNADNDSTVRIPATAHRVIAVGAYVSRTQWVSLNDGLQVFGLDNDIGEIAEFSSRGPTRDGRIKPELVAPGSMIASSLSKDSVKLLPRSYIMNDGVHAVNRGTSFAAPHVAGAAALLLQENPSLNTAGVLRRLKNNALQDNFTGFSDSNIFGHGKLDLNFDKPSTSPILSILSVLDENQNAMLDDPEIVGAVQSWITGGVLTGDEGMVITDEIIVWLIQLWIEQTDLVNGIG